MPDRIVSPEAASSTLNAIGNNLDNQIAYLSAILCLAVFIFVYFSRKAERETVDKMLDKLSNSDSLDRIHSTLEKISDSIADLKADASVIRTAHSDLERRVDRIEQKVN